MQLDFFGATSTQEQMRLISGNEDLTIKNIDIKRACKEIKSINKSEDTILVNSFKEQLKQDNLSLLCKAFSIPDKEQLPGQVNIFELI